MMKTKLTHQKRHFFSFTFSRTFFTILLFLLFTGLKSQDKIVLLNGDEINAKIVEISDSEIKYKQAEHLDGPTRIILKSEVFMIKYENGTKDVFSNGNATTSEPKPMPKPTRVETSATSDTVMLAKRKQKFGGPRFGVTHITPGTFEDELYKRGKNPTLIQIGWQFEQRIFSMDNGPTGLVEFVPLIAGLEQGIFLPSASVLIGLRGAGAQAPEFAVGPNVSVGGLGMVFAVGINFRSENINFPVNIAFVPSVGKREYDYVQQKSVIKQSGHRITVMVGFNMRKK